MKRMLMSVVLVLLAVPAQAGTFDFSFNDDSAQAEVALPLVWDDYGTTEGRLRLLYNDDEETALGVAGIDFIGRPGNIPGLTLGVGGRLYGGEADDDQELLALGVGARAEFAPPVLEGLGAAVKLVYAPQIFCWLDAERLFETGFRLFYAVTPKVRVHLEYQNIRSEFDDRGKWTIDDGVRLGFRVSF